MARNKLEKFAAINKMPHVFQNISWHKPALRNCEGKVVDYRNKWKTSVFNNNNPLILELACGYGEYTTFIAQQQPNVNIIGIDIKGDRIYRGAKYVQDQELPNAAFIRTGIELIDRFFGPKEVNEIWITFPDPHKRRKKHKKRLTSLPFLRLYQHILAPNGLIHLKTDSDILFNYTCAVVQLAQCPVNAKYQNVYEHLHEASHTNCLRIKTRYERLNLSNADTIKYIQFALPSVVNDAIDDAIDKWIEEYE